MNQGTLNFLAWTEEFGEKLAVKFYKLYKEIFYWRFYELPEQRNMFLLSR